MAGGDLIGWALIAAKAAGVLAVAGGATLAVRSAAARHGVWTLAVAVALLLPPAAAVAPAWRVAVLRPVPVDGRPSTAHREVRPPVLSDGGGPSGTPSVAPVERRPTTTVDRRRPWDAAVWVAVAWAIGVVLVGGTGAVGYVAAGRLVRSAVPVGDGPAAELARAVAAELGLRRVDLRAGGRVTTPVAAAVFRPVVLLPAEALHWSAERLRPVLLHEMAHVKRHDCATVLLAHACCAVHWFDPLAWLAAARMRAERERACDDAVLRHGGTDPAAYAELLLSVAAAHGRPVATVLMARRSGLRGRVRRVLDERVDRRPLRRRAAGVVVVVVTAASAGLATVRPTARVAITLASSLPAKTASLADVPPVVVRTEPAAGATDVDPARAEVRVTFSKRMADASWSWVTPDGTDGLSVAGRPRYLPDGRTCVLPVRLSARRAYAMWVNDAEGEHQNFADRDGRAPVPYLLVFKTKG